MPSRKQRRRREKLQRHEYEYVIETEEGEEIPLESAREAREASKGTDSKSDARGKPAKGVVGRGGRVIPEPSFQRVLRRSAIFAPLIGIFIYLTSSGDDDFSWAGFLFTLVLLLAFFMPFSYMVDVFVYRLARRRQERERASRRS
jgi:hypothetical protein